jgi:hypothetical protein
VSQDDGEGIPHPAVEYQQMHGQRSEGYPPRRWMMCVVALEGALIGVGYSIDFRGSPVGTSGPGFRSWFELYLGFR